MKRIAVITSVKPHSLNLGGGPSGLIWEIMNTLHKNRMKVEEYFVQESKSKVWGILHRYGFYFTKLKFNLDNYDEILVYPENLSMYLPLKYRKKAIIIGPDSPSLRDERICRMKKGRINQLIKKIFCFISRWNEYRLLRVVKKFIVVGKTDKRWMCFNKKIMNNKNLKEKVVFMRHPILNNVINSDFKISSIRGNKRFIFAGNLDKKYNEDFFKIILNELKEKERHERNFKLDILIIGERNNWLAEEFGKINSCHVGYMRWIENYNDICMLGQDVHCIPLVVGAGTKNRTLTAIANGLEVIATPIAIENIPYKNILSLYITRSPEKFLQYMLHLNGKNFKDKELNMLIANRKKFQEKVTIEYEKAINKYIENI